MIVGDVPANRVSAPFIPNPGTYISEKAELNMMITCYLACHYHQTRQNLTESLITVDRLNHYSTFKEAEEAYKEPTNTLKLTKSDKIMNFIVEWPEHLALYDGQNRRPLSYVICNKTEVPVETNDPDFG
jgi:hypothetical protein